ncbi:MAG TPA: CHAT domain-containing tetratricopeptide repeat protein [Candidatus Angelobacter sp.]|nr:CHAT domain-containing tetratricopeptide repeat protein [Candidatus Angelobacter sp.]
MKLAREEKNSWGEGEAHRILGLLAVQKAVYPVAQSEYEQALVLFETAQSPGGIALVHMHLGLVASDMGKPAEAVTLYRRALSEFEALNDLIDQARVLQSLAMTESLTGSEVNAYEMRALELARQAGDKGLTGHILHSMGDHLFVSGDYAGAIEKLNEAASLLQESGDRAGLSRVWTSLGRLYRVHGSYDEAITSYRKGLSIQQELGDKVGVIQSLNAMAIAYSFGGHPQEEMEHYERALALARETGSPRVLAFITGNVGGAYLNRNNDARAIELLEESLRLDPSSSSAENRYLELSGAYQGIERYAPALENADKAVELTRKSANLDILYQSLHSRSRAYQKLGRLPEALTDIQDSIQVAEEIRSKLIPADYLKAGYAERTQDLFSDAVEIHEQAGQSKEAMVVAEEARARAFLDLLASRGIMTGSMLPTASTEANVTESPSSGTGATKREQLNPGVLQTRGADVLKISEAKTTAFLPSRVAAAPPTFDELLFTARRLDSALLSYWVTPDVTFAWVLKPDGTVRGERLAVGSQQLSKLVRATNYGGEELESGPDAAIAAGSKPARPPANSTTRGMQTLVLRGGSTLVLRGRQEAAWRELYKLLIAPLRDALPAKGQLTIVPQGPLFRLSFAALQDEQGHYLVENYSLNYAPSLGVLRETGDRKQQYGRRGPSYLIVADPKIAPSLAEQGLPPLPGARAEARSLARLLPRGETTVLLGPDASKAALRERAAGKTVLHLATHAIVSDDHPFDSFLVLGAMDKSPPEESRLNVQEIYGMDLQTDLVVLSACRTGLGKLSGDGIAGLTRAFFYGGTPSVMATLWDVADEPTALLISDFYKSLQKDPNKSRALQSAQLQLIRRLREGRVRVNTSLGPVSLPEDPVFWAGFVLQGEP